MKNKNFIFVILHYEEINETVKFVESIKKIKNNYYNVKIVIVDNKSPNNSGIKLKNMYIGDKNVKVILNQKNLGFSKGQNVGFRYAKKYLNADYIALCNNDILMIQNEFLSIISNKYDNSDISVIGPKIIDNNNNIHMYSPIIKNKKELRKELKKYILLYLLYFFRISFVRKIYLKLKKKYKSDSANNYNFNKKMENICIHGSFMIFSKRYIDVFDGINDKTFFYKEEQFIARRLKKYNLTSIYDPELFVKHNNGIATSKANKNDRNKELFICKNEIYSIIQLLKAIEKNDF